MEIIHKWSRYGTFIECYIDGEIAGKIEIQDYLNVDMFEEDYEKENYDKYVANVTQYYVMLETLRVSPKFRRRGVANKLMEYLLDYINEETDKESIVLLASPFKVDDVDPDITRELLINFYEKHNFNLFMVDGDAHYMIHYTEHFNG